VDGRADRVPAGRRHGLRAAAAIQARRTLTHTGRPSDLAGTQLTPV
jgi:hypothetical protein